MFWSCNVNKAGYSNRTKRQVSHAHLDGWSVVAVDDLEGVVLDVLLHGWVVPGATHQPFHVEHGVLGVGCQLVLGCVTHQATIRGEGHVGGRDAVAKVIGDDFHLTFGVEADTGGKKDNGAH